MFLFFKKKYGPAKNQSKSAIKKSAKTKKDRSTHTISYNNGNSLKKAFS